MRYSLGILCALVSGLVFALSSIFQKRAVNAVEPGQRLFKKLVRSPVWLAAFLASLAIGAPLNMLAYVLLGPTLPPALGAIALAALPVAAHLFLGERPSRRDYAGATMIASGIALLGLTGLSIQPESIDWLDAEFLARATPYFCGIALCIFALGLLGKRPARGTYVALALAAGFAQALVNLLMGPISGQIAPLFSAGPDPKLFLVAGVASLALIGMNVLAISLSQVALRKGDVTKVAPIQQLPIQIVPIALHFGLYGRSLGDWTNAIPLLVGLILLLAGLASLGDAQAFSRADSNGLERFRGEGKAENSGLAE